MTVVPHPHHGPLLTFNIPMPRMWTICFADNAGAAWWAKFLRPGFQHVRACCYFAAEDRWIYFNSTRRGTIIEIYTPKAFEPRFAQIIEDSSLILAIPSAYNLRHTAISAYCVGAVKSLLGLNSWAITPYQLARALIRRGAEIKLNKLAEFHPRGYASGRQS